MSRTDAVCVMALVVCAAVLVAVGVLVAAQAAPAVQGPTYTDPAYGFAIRGPAFPKTDQGNVIPVMMFGPADGGFANNVNVVVQNVTTTRDAYRKLTLDQMKAAGYKVISDKDATVSGKDAVMMSFEGVQQGRNLQFLSLSVIDAGRVFVVTCTATKEAYAAIEKEFLACVGSFALAK